MVSLSTILSIDPAEPNDKYISTYAFSLLVLDLGAWVGTWMVALGAYAGRQERPYRRQDDTPKDDLPDVYIPNELSANEIEKAFSLAGKKQAVIEANEVSCMRKMVLIGSCIRYLKSFLY